MHKQQRWPQAWEYCEAKLIQTLGRASQGVDWSWSQCIKSHHTQTSSGKGLPSHFWNRNIVRSILPGLRRKITGLLLSGPKSFLEGWFCFSFGNQGLESGGRLERHRIQAAWSPVWSFWSQGWFGGAVTSAGICPLCFIKSKVNAAVYQETLEHLMHPSADKLYGDADFLFQQDFSTCPHCQNHFQVLCWPWYILLCLIGQPTCLTWTPYGIYGIFSREKWETVDPTIQMSWRLNSASAEPQADRFHAIPHWCWSLC